MMRTNALLALDVGEKRIGVAVIEGGVSIARPLMTIGVDGHEIEGIVALNEQYRPDTIVVGYPRNQSGEPTKQTKIVEEFADKLRENNLKIAFQDESLTSVIAEDHLKATKRPYAKADIDAVAAALILTDYAETH